MKVQPALILACNHFRINTVDRVAHFLAQVSHESGDLERTTENLNYSARALSRVWPTRFRFPRDGEDPRAEQFEDGRRNCNQFAYKAERIANIAYADRMGNGPEESGDGWRYRGRGYIQLTGADNYRRFSESYFGDDRLIKNPDAVANPVLAAMSAAWYWRRSGCNRLADLGDIVAITRAINGGLTGLDDRKRRVTMILSELDTR